jgi:hypothetical protein
MKHDAAGSERIARRPRKLPLASRSRTVSVKKFRRAVGSWRIVAGTSALAAAISLYSPSTASTCAIRRPSVPKSTPIGLPPGANQL